MSINLTKGQQISLNKTDGGALSLVRMGLGWQATPRKGFLAKLTAREIDLDASAVLYANKEPVDVVYFQHLVSNDGSVRHTGDNLTGGAGQGGDDESIVVDLQRVPTHVDQIVFTVNSFTGQTFAQVSNAFCRLIDDATGQELARYTLTGGGSDTAQIMAKVHRSGSGWQMAAIGAPPTAAPSRTSCPQSHPTCNTAAGQPVTHQPLVPPALRWPQTCHGPGHTRAPPRPAPPPSAPWSRRGTAEGPCPVFLHCCRFERCRAGVARRRPVAYAEETQDRCSGSVSSRSSSSWS